MFDFTDKTTNKVKIIYAYDNCYIMLLTLIYNSIVYLTTCYLNTCGEGVLCIN